MKLSEQIRAESYPCGDPDWMPKLEKLEADNVALKRGIEYIRNLTTETTIAQTCAILLTEQVT